MQVVDLTLPLGPDTPVFPGDPEVSVTRLRTQDVDGYEVARLCMGSHSGTHIDAPRHFFPEGATLDQYPIDRFVGDGVILDVRRSGGGLIDRACLADQLRAFASERGDFVLLWADGAPLSAEAARLLLDMGAGLVGTDGDSLDPPADSRQGEQPFPVHRLLLGGGVLLAENLCNLEILGPGRVRCAFLPLAVAGTDGAPARAIAWR